ncbi:hypothetical protein PsYK624_068870 [Phanerochaete sordida]|uniref:Uncharacterized protein n=1 Tax=Phanerochaete sordida TaxID=48140 RepID=A0A9P3G9F4_9APHY|nr:hypothetical protein PsYK624_068870 [Phanerochaete sordida]
MSTDIAMSRDSASSTPRASMLRAHDHRDVFAHRRSNGPLAIAKANSSDTDIFHFSPENGSTSIPGPSRTRPGDKPAYTVVLDSPPPRPVPRATSKGAVSKPPAGADARLSDDEATFKANAPVNATGSFAEPRTASWSPYPSARGKYPLDSIVGFDLQELLTNNPPTAPPGSAHPPARRAVQGSLPDPGAVIPKSASPPRFDNLPSPARRPSARRPTLTRTPPTAVVQRDPSSPPVPLFFPTGRQPPSAGPSSSGSAYSYGPYKLESRPAGR